MSVQNCGYPPPNCVCNRCDEMGELKAEFRPGYDEIHPLIPNDIDFITELKELQNKWNARVGIHTDTVAIRELIKCVDDLNEVIIKFLEREIGENNNE